MSFQLGEHDMIVFHHSPTIPPQWFNANLEGRWVDMSQWASGVTRVGFWMGTRLVAVAAPTNRFEANGIGQVAEIWEVRLPDDADRALLTDPPPS